MVRHLRWLAVVSVSALMLAACSSDGDAGSTDAPNGSAAATSGDGATAYPEGDISIMAPADPGGGWDGTARAMQGALESDVLDASVDVYNVGGAGGTIGLAEFVENQAGNANQLMVMGLVMVGAIRTNDATVTLDDVTPVASLTAEQEAIAVPADSEYETLEQLVEDWKTDPTSISWGGGSAGGTDHILVGLMAQEAGIDPADVSYVAHAGGGEALSAILSGAVTAGVSGVSEFADQVEAGEMRWLAVSGETAPEGIDAPTITESGLDVVLENWRGVVAAPDISDSDREAIVSMVTAMHDSPSWQQALTDNGWSDFFQVGDEFESFLADERTRVEEVLHDIGLIS